MNKRIVFIKPRGARHKEDASWQCPTESEAERMVKWLIDNLVEAVQMTSEEWEALPDYADMC